MDEMQNRSDAQLLRDYAERGSEPAFREIVARYTDLVYSAAVRQMGLSGAAADIAQSVFIDLARKAPRLAEKLLRKGSLAGWLHRSTRFAALNQLRDARRRRDHERQAMEQLLTDSQSPADWERIRPALDEALDSLPDDDREALLLRYFKNQDLRSVGAALGVSDDAAQKRVSRAIERLRELFAKRGVQIGVSGLAAVIGANAIQAAPAGIAAAMAGAALAGAAAKASGVSTCLFQLMTLTKSKIAIVGFVVATGVTTPLLIQYRHNARLSRENIVLRRQVDQLSEIRDAVEKLPTIPPDTENAEVFRKQQTELLRLRGMIGVQRRQEMELQRQLEAAESRADFAKFEAEMLRQRRSQGAQAWGVTPTSLPGNFSISTLQPAGQDTAANASQSILYAVFHHAVDAYQGLALNPPPQNDPTYSEQLASTRRLWSGEAAQGIKNLKIAQFPSQDGHSKNRYMLNFMIDYGTNGRPAGAPTHGSITLQQTADGWKADGFGSSIDPTLP